jgi:hypothetical protein
MYDVAPLKGLLIKLSAVLGQTVRPDLSIIIHLTNESVAVLVRLHR